MGGHGFEWGKSVKLAVIVHRWDLFDPIPAGQPNGPRPSPYLLYDVLESWRARGNDWAVATPGRPVDADAAFLHVVPTLVDEEHRAFAAGYGTVINGGTWDIHKRRVSRNLLAPDSDWAGPVIVKSDLNNFGKIEQLHNLRAAEAGKEPPHRDLPRSTDYRIYARLDQVPQALWDDPGLVVEKFLPEANPDGTFTLRTWVFLGTRERCTKLVGPNPVSKAAQVLHYEPTDVPDELRAERARLGFDYGKFDFVIHEGTPVLLDANRTPGNPRTLQEHVKKGAANLAEGLAMLLGSK